MTDTPIELMLALKEIQHYYSDDCAKRSGVPLMNHINEGIAILQAIGSDTRTQAAFALHPITQNEYVDQYDWLYAHDQNVLELADNYADTANKYLCRPETDHIQTTEDLDRHLNSRMRLEVAEMLYADKIQNRKDFILYHLETHERSAQLDRYFNLWIEYLNRWIM